MANNEESKIILNEERERFRELRDDFDEKWDDINAQWKYQGTNLEIDDVDSKEEHILYFAYGSNMDEERLLKRGFKIYGKCGGILKGYKLVFNKIVEDKGGEGYANISEDKDLEVEGVIYETDFESMKNLDKWEGFPKHYDKKIVLVEDKRKYAGRISVWGSKNQKLKAECIVYIAQPEWIAEGLKPSKEYLSHLLKAKDFLSPEYIRFLESVETID